MVAITIIPGPPTNTEQAARLVGNDRERTTFPNASIRIPVRKHYQTGVGLHPVVDQTGTVRVLIYPRSVLSLGSPNMVAMQHSIRIGLAVWAKYAEPVAGVRQ